MNWWQTLLLIVGYAFGIAITCFIYEDQLKAGDETPVSIFWPITWIVWSIYFPLKWTLGPVYRYLREHK